MNTSTEGTAAHDLAAYKEDLEDYQAPRSKMRTKAPSPSARTELLAIATLRTTLTIAMLRATLAMATLKTTLVMLNGWQEKRLPKTRK